MNETTPPVLSLVIPTLNERDNISNLIKDIQSSLGEIPYEILFVDDDSPDGTGEVIQEFSKHNPRIKLIHRDVRNGLSAAILEGFKQATGQFWGVMDSDLSHDSKILPDLLKAVQGGMDVAVGSRRVKGGGADHWPLHRRLYSSLATLLARYWLRCPIADPMSGFFIINKSLLDNLIDPLNPKGYKILLEILTRTQTQNVTEVPFIFTDRKQGVSKLSSKVAWHYLSMLWDLKHYSIPMHKLRSTYHTGRYRKVKGPLRDGALLDIGCGRPCETMPEQAFLRYLKRDDVTGVDIKRLRGPYPFVQGSITALPFPDNRFNNVVAMEVLEHLEDVDKAVSEVHRVLNPEGIFIMTTPDCHPFWDYIWHKWTHFIGQMWHDAHLVSYRSQDWKKILEKKFKVLSVRRHWFFDLIFVCQKS